MSDHDLPFTVHMGVCGLYPTTMSCTGVLRLSRFRRSCSCTLDFGVCDSLKCKSVLTPNPGPDGRVGTGSEKTVLVSGRVDRRRVVSEFDKKVDHQGKPIFRGLDEG